MDEKLDFSLPEKRRRSSVGGGLGVLLLLVVVVLGAANLYVGISDGGGADEVTSGGLSASEAKQLATKLAGRNLHDRAAEVWIEYLAAGQLSDEDRAKGLFQVGVLCEKAGRYDDAIEYFYRSETAMRVAELEGQINTHVRSCFEKLGKFSALRYELMDRTSLKQGDGAGATVVAEIGAEKITEADLSAAIERAIENQLEPMKAFMTAEQVGEQKKKALEQYKSPQARQQFLGSWLAEEVLYRQALADGVAEEDGVKRMVDDLTRGLLSQQVMNDQIASKVNITETDLQTYYEANKADYTDPAKAAISHVLVAGAGDADKVIERIKGGEAFEDVAGDVSLDGGTKDVGGAIEAAVTMGGHVAVIGDANGLNEAIFAAEAGALIEQAFETEKGWEVVKVRDRSAERLKGFDEVRQEVMMSLMNSKRQDVQQEFLKTMMDKYNVIIHSAALGGDEGRGGK